MKKKPYQFKKLKQTDDAFRYDGEGRACTDEEWEYIGLIRDMPGCRFAQKYNGKYRRPKKNYKSSKSQLMRSYLDDQSPRSLGEHRIAVDIPGRIIIDIDAHNGQSSQSLNDAVKWTQNQLNSANANYTTTWTQRGCQIMLRPQLYKNALHIIRELMQHCPTDCTIDILGNGQCGRIPILSDDTMKVLVGPPKIIRRADFPALRNNPAANHRNSSNKQKGSANSTQTDDAWHRMHYMCVRPCVNAGMDKDAAYDWYNEEFATGPETPDRISRFERAWAWYTQRHDPTIGVRTELTPADRIAIDSAISKCEFGMCGVRVGQAKQMARILLEISITAEYQSSNLAYQIYLERHGAADVARIHAAAYHALLKQGIIKLISDYTMPAFPNNGRARVYRMSLPASGGHGRTTCVHPKCVTIIKNPPNPTKNKNKPNLKHVTFTKSTQNPTKNKNKSLYSLVSFYNEMVANEDTSTQQYIVSDVLPPPDVFEVA